MAEPDPALPMPCSASIATLVAALAKAQLHFPEIGKDRVAVIRTKSGGEFTYAYADLATVVTAVRKPLAENGLAILQPVHIADARVAVTTVLAHASGEWVASTLALPVADAADARSLASSITYARRYGLIALVGVAAADEDDDGEATVAAAPARRAPAPRPTPKSATPAGPPTPPARELAPVMDERDRLTDRQRRLLFATARDHGWNESDLRAEIERGFGCTSTNDLHREDLDQLLNLLKRRPKVPPPPNAPPPSDEGV
jgi:hypothetical protein